MSFAKTVFSAAASVLMLSTVLGGAVTLAYLKQVSVSLPDIKVIGDWKPAQGSRIFSSDGVLLGVHAKEYREFVPLEEIPPLVVAAFLSAEDGNFWQHNGVDPVGIARALISNLKGQRVSGGSTIPQQLVKNLLLSPEKTMERKAKEALLAMKIVKEIGKPRILEIYLNQIYLGGGRYGVAAAADFYFGKKLDQLTAGEAAVLAGLPQAPSAGNPFVNMKRAVDRRNYVLDRMARLFYLTPEDAARFKASPIVLSNEPQTIAVPDPSVRYAEETVRRLEVAQVGEDNFYSKGGEVRASINFKLQQIVHSELRRGLVIEDRKGGWRGPIAQGLDDQIDWTSETLKAPAGAEDWKVGVVRNVTTSTVDVETIDGSLSLPAKAFSWALRGSSLRRLLNPGDVILLGDSGDGLELQQIPDVEGAVVVMQPETGAVMALDGGFSPDQSEFNRATQAKRQPGSVFKPFVYLTALQAGYNAMSPVLDSPIEIDNEDGTGAWRPQEDERGLGLITLRQALEKSRNHATVRLLYDLGIDQVRETAQKLGLEIPDTASYSMALGTVEMTPISIATAYCAIANGGHPVKATFLDPVGTPARTMSAPPVFDPVSIAQLSSVLEGVSYAGTASKAFDGFQHPIAAKTGTTNGSRDVWLAAYGPKFVIVSWIGHDDFKPLHKGAAGGETVAPLVRRILDRSEGVLQFEDFTLPEGAETVRADRATGQLDPTGDVVEIVRSGEVQYDEQPNDREQASRSAVQPDADAGAPAETDIPE